jgi:hypothetical protein
VRLRNQAKKEQKVNQKLQKAAKSLDLRKTMPAKWKITVEEGNKSQTYYSPYSLTSTVTRLAKGSALPSAFFYKLAKDQSATFEVIGRLPISIKIEPYAKMEAPSENKV